MIEQPVIVNITMASSPAHSQTPQSLQCTPEKRGEGECACCTQNNVSDVTNNRTVVEPLKAMVSSRCFVASNSKV